MTRFETIENRAVNFRHSPINRIDHMFAVFANSEVSEALQMPGRKSHGLLIASRGLRRSDGRFLNYFDLKRKYLQKNKHQNKCWK